MDVWIKKVGVHRGRPRIFLDGVQAARAGFSPGESFEVEVDGQRVTLTKKTDGSRVVSSRERNGRTAPVIDINSGEILKVFEGMESIRVIVTPRAVYLMPMASEVKRVERLERLRSKLREGQPISTGSISHGGGVLSHAIHQGLKDAGVQADLAMANEIREDLVMQAIEHNDVWDDKAMALAMPMQELMQDDWVLSKLPPVELLEMGLPCSGAGRAGIARKGLDMMESHEHVGHLVASAIAIINRVQPALVLLENVPLYASTASAQILRGTLRDMGYDIHEEILSGQDFGVIEDRVRWAMVAVTRGMEFSFEDIKPDVSIIRTVDEYLDPSIGPDDPRWRTFEYLQVKRERDQAKGSNFKPQVVTEHSTLVPTLRKGCHKGGSTDPRLAHPSDPGLSRLFTAQEHARIKGVPESLIADMSETNAHQLLGQGIVYEPFRAVGVRIGQCLQAFAAQAAQGSDAIRAALPGPARAQGVSASLQLGHEGVSQGMLDDAHLLLVYSDGAHDEDASVAAYERPRM